MKKFTLLLTALLITSFSALAQIKLVVCQEGGARSEFIASSVDSIIFVGQGETPSDPVKPDTPVVPETGSFVAKPFSVSATKTVTFSPGNLQYHAANNEWRFAPNQTDYIGEDNENISSTYNGWIDLFCWGTGNNPTNTSKYNEDYPTFVDWGVNKISSYAPNTWRTLTYDEWYYLRYERPNYDKLIGVAQVNGVNGLILLPDDWICPSGLTFKSGFHDDYRIEYLESYAEYQTFSSSDWAKLEASGAVFFPAAGVRYGSDVRGVQNGGNCWSATEYYYYSAYYLNFYTVAAKMLDYNRYFGLSVRLVQDVATDPDDDPVAPPVKPDDGDDDIDTPEVELPGEGKIRFIVDATAVGACYGLGIEGNFCGYDPDAAFKGTEFAENMFYIDMPSMTAVEFGNAKILLLDEDGSSDWHYQVLSYGYDIKGSEDYITIIDDLDGTQNAINLVADNIDNVVIKIKILKVHSIYHPCKPDVPAGPEDDEIVDPDKPINPDDDPVVPGTGGFVAKPFSVSATKTVTFSPGNLQYHAANDEWRFAPSQTDYIGNDNENISSSYNGWIDLFGWGTGNNPTNKSTDYGDYQTFVDWGVNKIGSYSPNTWRTLTYDEWYYLRYQRPNYDKLIGVAQVNGVNGLILLPDAWVCPSGVTFKAGFHNDWCTECYGNYQTISALEWSKLEASGAVFLPAAGFCNGSDVYGVQYGGYYWSATEFNSYFANYLYFDSDEACMGYYDRCYGQSVRLVQD